MTGPEMVEMPLRFTEHEREHVERLAAMKGQTVSDLLREASGFVPESDIRVSRPERHLRPVEVTQ
jgi:hypothetical protein